MRPGELCRVIDRVTIACGLNRHHHREVNGGLGAQSQFALLGLRGSVLLFAGTGFGGLNIDVLSFGSGFLRAVRRVLPRAAQTPRAREN